MADSFIQLPADSTGKQLDTALVNMGVGTTAVHREKVILSDPTSTSGFATVTSSAGVLANLSSGTVTLSSTPTVTATAATNPWSSAPGFNVPVVTVSSGLLQAYQVGTWTVQTTAGTAINTSSAIGLPSFHAITPTSSVAGASLAPVTSSAGLLGSLSSGTVTLSSNPTVISASSGLVQIAGTVTVLSASSGLIQTLSSGAIVLSSVGLTQISGVPTVAISSTAPATGKFIVATSISKVTSSATTLWGYVAFTTAPSGEVIRFYNAATGSVVMNTGVVLASPVSAQSSVGGNWQAQMLFGPRGFNFATACSFDVVLNAASTLAVAGKCFVTAFVN